MDTRRPDGSGEVIPAAALPVDPTGVPGLDVVVGGGLPRGSLVLVAGPPGSGKTTLAGHLAFAAARAGRRVLILTTLSEPPSKLLANLRTYHFYAEDLVGDRVQVLSLRQFLPQGLDSAAEAVAAMARQVGASLVVLDGFRGVRRVTADPRAARQFLYDIGGLLSLAGTTAVITTEGDVRDAAFYAEATGADVVIGLLASLDDVRQQRGLAVIKARAATPLPGLHGLLLSAAGATVYPRLEARVALAADADEAGAGPETAAAAGGAVERATFDLPELDGLLGGGLTRASATLVVGSTGTGKTLLALHFALAGARAGEPTLFLGFHETLDQLRLKADPFDLGRQLRAAVAAGGGLTFMRRPPVELNADILANDLLAALDRTRARRLVVDSIGDLERAVTEGSDGRRVANYLAALVEALQARGVTTLFTKESGAATGAELNLSSDLIAVAAANVVWLRQIHHRERLQRVLSVAKMRFSAHDDTLRPFTIAPPKGIDVFAPFESDGGTLSGIAGPLDMPASGPPSAGTAPSPPAEAPETL